MSITGFSTEASYITCILTLHLSFPNTMYTASQSAPNFKAFFFFLNFLKCLFLTQTFLIFMQAMPVNFKFVIEGMEEAGSLGLEKLLEEENQSFFSDVDYIVISDNLWLSNKKPALTYGSRGNACFFVEVKDTGSFELSL